MSLAAGTRLGSYEVTSRLGRGGMGEVYRARDTKLNRDVAIKVLPDSVATDPERLARFHREAQVLASLNHPNIAHIYGVEDSTITHGLVMELIEGPTLADRIAEGAIPLREALPIAKQIAEALEAAHEEGIIHRDLKPANIKVREDGTVKVLDFGLAKLVDPAAAAQTVPGALAPDSPTIVSPAMMTSAGVILGTASYMSPEQARGRPLDRRSDIWSFGVVLYEMVTGARLFAGDTTSDVLARVLTWDPPLDRAPVEVHRLLRHCLEKDPSRRLRDVADAHLLLDNSPSTARVERRESKLGWAVASALAIALAATFWWRAVPPPSNVKSLRLNLDVGPEAIAGPNFGVAISPDGSRLVVLARGSDGRTQLATRRVNEGRLTLLGSDTSDAVAPFVSPDGGWIGFFSGGQMKKVSIEGGAAVTICDAVGLLGASWGDDQQIVFAAGTTAPLLRVAASGGRAAPVTRVGELGDATHRFPQVLPGARAVLFTSHKIVTGFDDARIEALVLATGERKVVWQGGYFGRYVRAADGRGYLSYVHDGTLFAIPFDAAALKVTGTPVALVDNLAGNADVGAGQMDVSRNGTLIYQMGKASPRTWQILWLDAAGHTEPLVTEPGAYYTPRLSPDGTRLAMMLDQGEKGREIAVYDLQRASLSRLTFTGEVNLFPVWSPDGRYIVFESSTSTGYGIGLVRSDGSGTLQRLAEHTGLMIPTSFSPDGRTLAYYQAGRTVFEAWTATFDASDSDRPKLVRPAQFQPAPFALSNLAFSPDGHWMAYTSTESGRQEVYVRPFATGGAKTKVSTGGGNQLIWSTDGRELFYRNGSAIMVAEYLIRGDQFVVSSPRAWSTTPLGLTPFGRDYTLATDGKRFAIFPPRNVLGTGPSQVGFIVNFFDALRSGQ